MPTKPQVQTLEANAPQILNAVRNAASPYYQSVVPYAEGTTESIREIGKIMMTYQAVQNEFLDLIYNRIGRVIIESKMYSNPWSRFKKGMLEFGETIESIFVELAKPFPYNPKVAEEKLFARVIPDVRAAFYHLNYQVFYKVTIQNEDLTTAFLSWSGVENLIAKIVDSLYNGANYDEFQMMKYMIALHALRGTLNPIPIGGVAAENMKSIAATMKGVSNEWEFMSSKWNFAGVRTYTNKPNQLLIINAKVDAVMDVEVLASAFNMSKAEFMGQRVLVDSFGAIDVARLDELLIGDPNYHHFTDAELKTLDAIPAVLLDVDWFQIYDKTERYTEVYNPEGLYWNDFLHVWKVYAVSPFANNAMFTIGQPVINSISILNTNVNIMPGAVVQLYVKVDGENFAPSSVTWTSTSPLLHISPAGELTCDAGFTGTATVTATSTWDDTKTASVTVTGVTSN